MIHALAIAASLLYGAKAPEAERRQKLDPLFSPRPGAPLELERLSLLENSKRPSYIRGQIWVKPPKGLCLIVRTDMKKPDQNVCKAKPISWEIDDLDAAGRLRLHVSTPEEWDDGLDMIWTSPYRLATLVAAGDKEAGSFEEVPIQSCKAKTVENERSITLETFAGRKFFITLPEFDTPIASKQAESPNLIVNIDTAKTKEAEKAKAAEHGKDEHEKKDEHGAPEPAKDEHGPPKEAAKGGGTSVLGQLLTKGYNQEAHQEEKFTLNTRHAYKMESGYFSETGAPRGMTGICRYIFKNAPGDPDSGAIECHDTDTLDSIYVHVTCFSQLKVHEKPKSDAKEKP